MDLRTASKGLGYFCQPVHANRTFTGKSTIEIPTSSSSTTKSRNRQYRMKVKRRTKTTQPATRRRRTKASKTRRPQKINIAKNIKKKTTNPFFKQKQLLKRSRRVKKTKSRLRKRASLIPNF